MSRLAHRRRRPHEQLSVRQTARFKLTNAHLPARSHQIPNTTATAHHMRYTLANLQEVLGAQARSVKAPPPATPITLPAAPRRATSLAAAFHADAPTSLVRRPTTLAYHPAPPRRLTACLGSTPSLYSSPPEPYATQSHIPSNRSIPIGLSPPRTIRNRDATSFIAATMCLSSIRIPLRYTCNYTIYSVNYKSIITLESRKDTSNAHAW